MSVQSIAFAPAVTPTLPATRPPARIVDPPGALEALGDLSLAADRRSLRDLLGAWCRYCQAVDRRDLLAVAPRLPGIAIAIDARIPDGWRYLSGLALAAARNINAVDGERHWQLAAQAFMQAATNAAAVNGTRVASGIREWEREGWDDTDGETGEVISTFDPELVEGLTEQAAHYAQFALGEFGLGFNESRRRDARGQCAIETVIADALREAGCVCTDGTVDVCSLCHGIDSHTADCVLRPLSADHLLRVYAAAHQRRV